ncbi:MAG: molybdenum cofactor biosynthesis protein MoaE [Ignavibacteriaceae bacterium]
MDKINTVPAGYNYKNITSSRIDIMKLINNCHSPEAGGVVIFIGDVRNNNLGQKVKHLEYEAFIPLADKMIEEIVDAAVKKWELIHAAAIHRIGKVEISESAVAVITSHAHRKEAYEASQYIINRIKHEAPIWKCEYYRNGTYKWSDNCASCQ